MLKPLQKRLGKSWSFDGEQKEEYRINYILRKCHYVDTNFIFDLKVLCLKWYIEKIYTWDDKIQKEKTLNELHKNLQNMRIIIADNKDIGVTTFEETEDYFRVGLIMIHPDYQRKGIGTDIISKYIKTAKENNKRIIIKTYRENPARNLYERLGFKIYNEDNTHIYLEIDFAE